ncbi:MAG: hypothetical protein WC462_02875 [archaeon]
MSIKEKLIKPIANFNEELAQHIGKIRVLQGKTENIINGKSNLPIKNPKVCIVYLASPSSHIHTPGFMGLKKTTRKIEILKESLKTAINFLPEYPILIFHEDYTKSDKTSIKKIVKNHKIDFIKVDFKHYKGHSNLDEWMKKQKGFVEGRPSGYRMMCRFFCGLMQNHSALNGFDYYIRMDHDSFFIEPKTLNVEESIKKYNFDYLYRSVWTDHKGKKAIWEFTKKYAKKNNLSLKGFGKLRMLNLVRNFNGRAPYNNFHISKISFWRNPKVKKFLKAIEDENGILVKHWQDTNIHSMVLGLFNATVLEKTDFGYKHNVHYSLLGSLKIKCRKK